jgi:CRISPR-associated protein Csd1
MYLGTPVRWLLDLDSAGHLLGFVQTSSGKNNDRGKELLAPTIGRSSGVKPKLLCDNGEYVLGLARDPAKAERVRECHDAFKDLVYLCADETGEPSVHSVVSFLDGLDPSALSLPEAFTPADTITFRVEGVLPIDVPSVRAFWAQQTTNAAGEGHTTKCLVCGAACIPTDRMPVKIKHVPGGQPSGMALISANAKAFESFGLEASLISPICHECAEHHAKGANALMEDERTRIFLGPLVYVFWTKVGDELSFANLLSNPQPDDVKELLAGAFTGREAVVDEKAFYAAAFSASGGRVVVRDWLETTVPAARANIRRWFKLQRITENDGTEGHPLGLFPLASSLVRDARKDLSPNVPKAMLHSALHGGSLPSGLLFEAVKRNRAEQGLTRPRAALIKMVLLSQMESLEEDTMEKLDLDNKAPAYLCGRLLAVLESVQYEALGKTNTTVTNRFYGTASSAPASVFGRLLRGAQAHMGKLRNQKPGTCDALQRRLEEVTAGLPQFPLVLDMQAQGLFALGYYHQKAEDRRARMAYAEVKEAKSDHSEPEQ